VRWLGAMCWLLGVNLPVWAQDFGPLPEDALPIPTLEFDRLPPQESSEFAVQMGYGTVTFFREQVQPWIGFGFRGGWGRHLGEMGRHRIGPSFTAVAEGPVGVHTTLGLEPALAWDQVSEQGLLVGASMGPSFMWFIKTDRVGAERDQRVVPSAAIRLGWSQTYSRVGRRLFVFVEPKCRVIDGVLNPVATLAVGSGSGR
jgi:hypothetical protein